jgi:hypothetical protein
MPLKGYFLLSKAIKPDAKPTTASGMTAEKALQSFSGWRDACVDILPLGGRLGRGDTISGAGVCIIALLGDVPGAATARGAR